MTQQESKTSLVDEAHTNVWEILFDYLLKRDRESTKLEELITNNNENKKQTKEVKTVGSNGNKPPKHIWDYHNDDDIDNESRGDRNGRRT